MMSKLLIVNNSLKDLRGHFFETSLAVAEAARTLGFRPVLGAHSSCSRGLIPHWLEFHPVFTTDHWMVAPLPKALQLAERLLPLSWHQPAHRLLRTPWQVLNRGRNVLRPRSVETSDPLAKRLQNAGIEQEFEHMNRFCADLLRFLELSDCQPDDHVFLPTAHGRELAAIQRLNLVAPPTFHLEFRHDLEKFRYQVRHRVFFNDAHKHALEGINLYTDTEELSEEYEAFSGLPFGVLPIPFRSRLLCEKQKQSGPLCVAYFGDVRDEKGFHWLPDLVQAFQSESAARRMLLTRRVSEGRPSLTRRVSDGTPDVRFMIQASIDPTNRNPRSLAALRKLERMDRNRVELIGREGPLTPEEYYHRFSEADVLLCPYDGTAYRSRSSGTFTEALAAGIPTVVPANSWMAHQQPAGSGEAFNDRAGFIAAVRQIYTDYAQYGMIAEEHCADWLARHSPENLVRTLTAGAAAKVCFRPEGPILSAQAEGLGLCTNGSGRPCKGRSISTKGVEPSFQDGRMYAIRSLGTALSGPGPFTRAQPRPSAWADGIGPSGREKSVTTHE